MKHAKHDRYLSRILGKPALTIILFAAVAIALGGLLVAGGVFALDNAPQSRMVDKASSSSLNPETLTFPQRAFIPLIRAATVPLPPPLPPPLVLSGAPPIDFAAEEIELPKG